MKRFPGLLLGTVLVVGALAGCAPEPVTFPTDRVELVASYGGVGGMVPTSFLVMQAPSLLVYSDGRVVATARHTLRLDRDDLADLVRDLRGDLAGLDANLSSRGSRQIMDAGATTFQVRRADGSLQSVSAAALGAVDDYPRGVNQADARMRDLYERVDKHGDRYTSERVRLALQPDTQTTPAGTWPAAVAVPEVVKYGVRTADLAGDTARAAVAALPDAEYDQAGGWTVYQLPDGSRYQVAWRYLAPDEAPVR